MTRKPAFEGLPPSQQLAAPGKWPIVGERSPAAGVSPWPIEVMGLVEAPLLLRASDLEELPRVKTSVDIHCVTRWSKPGVWFEGVHLKSILQTAKPESEARFVSFVSRSTRDHSTSLPLEEVINLGTIVALSCDGQPLPSEHGGPVRVVVPGRYFYKSLKWLKRIELLAEDRLGYWEATAGYHNHADPWKEERYLAPTITRQQAAAAIASRDFRGLDLRSIDARGHELSGLLATQALLRDADFQGADLSGAQFDEANLSNARLQGANLQRASFRQADVEGADFTGADLRGADFRGASLLGTTFIDNATGAAATIDGTTAFDQQQLDELTPAQAEFVRHCLKVC